MAKQDVVKQIRKATRRRFFADEKIRIVLEGLRGQISVSELCRKEGIAPSIYYKCSKAFPEAGKNGLTLDTKRDATSDEVRRLKSETEGLKKALAELMLDNMLPDRTSKTFPASSQYHTRTTGINQMWQVCLTCENFIRIEMRFLYYWICGKQEYACEMYMGNPGKGVKAWT